MFITASSPQHDRARDLMPRWTGWVAKNYGPNAQYIIRYQAPLAWKMESRAFWKSLRAPFWNAARNPSRQRAVR
jgi:hypothetical protein